MNKDRLETILALVWQGIDTDKDGNTPLMLAMLDRQEEIARTLKRRALRREAIALIRAMPVPKP